ncbi:MAG: hydroxymethylglutaryl-CoA reductase, degradative [Candidatus Thermoplasmatota archaeon]|nr:hydroxymethylglutaryl-CoA reductase, degradative [Candidatus Thermoplasmatota archaeon]
MGSDIPGLYRMTVEERVGKIMEAAGLTREDMAGLSPGGTSIEVLDGMIENVIGTFQLPVGIATNFVVNGIERLIPMATEEPSVVAAASKAAKIARTTGGFFASSTDQVMIGQVQICDLEDPGSAIDILLERKQELLDLANSRDPLLVKFGGGARDIEIRVLESPVGPMIILHILVDTRDAMGANAVNTMAEAIAPRVEELTGGKVVLRILSNLALHRLSTVKAVFPKEELGGDEGVNLILKAYYLAEIDPFRAVTHNKGIMNGVSAVVRVTGNDTRAVEAGAHSYAAMTGKYLPLTNYSRNENGDLIGEIIIPAAVGLVGGATKVHPAAKASIKILGIKTAAELGEVLAAVGLAQNLAALRALAIEGIQRGHMKLHARNLSIQSGASPEEAEAIVSRMLQDGDVSASKAAQHLEEMRG